MATLATKAKRGERAAAALGLLVLGGCPQLLSDDFELDRPSGPDAGGSNTGPDESDLTPPTVISVVPVNGARGVPPDSTIVVSFSEPMDPRSVEQAYTSTDLPPQAVVFSWSGGDSVLRIQPVAALSVASGSDPATVRAASYEYGISSGAEDRAGNALAPLHVEFSVVREIAQSFASVRERSLTGTWRSDGVYGVADCEEVDTTVCVGDSISGDEATYKGFVTFDWGALPAGDFGLTAARLGLDISLLVGTPFQDLGALELEHVQFAEIGSQAFNAAALSVIGALGSSGDVGDSLGINVLAAVNADRQTRSRSQYRLVFASATDADGAADIVMCDWSSLQLTLTYRTP